MGDRSGSFATVVLAAGAASRFGGAKLLAPLDGRPLLDHVLDAVRAAVPGPTVVVLGHGAEAIEAAIAWGDERRVINPDPDAGLASSLQVGFAALATLPDAGDLPGAFVVLGDQPLVDPAVFRALAAAEVRAGIAFVAPRYVGGGGANPVLVLRPGWPWIEQARGDRGLGPILAAHPELVAEVELGGANPDVDTRADLAELAWADRVRRDHEQVDRHREVPDGSDFYGPVTSLFRADPRRTDEPALDRLLALAEPADTWLDIGAGAGRYALPLALHVAEVVAIEPSAGMRAALAELDGRARHRQRPGDRRPLAARARLAGVRAPRRRRPDRPPRLRHRGDRTVPRRDGGGRRAALRGRPDGAPAVVAGRPVLAADPRRGTRPPAGPQRARRAPGGARPRAQRR